jgi:DNA-binding LacI/PurR family transcriptional regulator
MILPGYLMNKVTDIIITPNSVISLHVQLHNQLRQLILSGHWPNATRIPSESQFAEHLKLSRTTVRLALQRAEIEGLIERIAGRGTFVAYASTNARGSHLIAFLTSGFDAENQLVILTGIESEVKARGYQIIFSTARNPQEEISILKKLKKENAAGALLWPNANSPQGQEHNAIAYRQLHLPIVLIDRKIYGFDCDCVTSDNFGGAEALMEHLVELGHQHVAFLTHHEMALLSVMERHRAYCEVLEGAGLPPIPPWLIGQPGKEIGAGYSLHASVDMKSPELLLIKEYMLNAEPRPTAIFALNDYLAVLAMRAMKLLNLKVPDSVSIAGFDDIDLAMHLEVPLTTVAQDSFTIGKRAAQLLIDRIEGYSGPAVCEYIPTQLRVRSSTSVPARA